MKVAHLPELLPINETLDIGFLTRAAEEIVLAVNELNAAASSETITKLGEALEQGNAAA
jgi:hypothetical protein